MNLFKTMPANPGGMPLLLTLFLLIALLRAGHGQNNPAGSLVGVWQGTSICQLKNSPCHDEIVVYHISLGTADSSVVVKANKIVDNKEEEMGDIHFVFNRNSQQLRSTDYNAIWLFTLEGNKLIGTLTYRGALYRIINVTKKQ